MSRWIERLIILALAVMLATAPLSQAEAFQSRAPVPDLVVPASQSVDPCYKRCVMNRAWGSRTNACMFTCNRVPSRRCEDRCYRQEPNRPLHRDACIARCLRR